MASLQDIAAQGFMGAFNQTFDPHGAKKQAVSLKQSAEERAQEQHEQNLDLKEQQIMQARIKTKMQQDAIKADKLAKKFSASGQSPDVAAEMWNSMGYGTDLEFDRSHWESTQHGGKRQAVEPKPSLAGQTEDRLKPDAQRAGSIVGGEGGEYRFRQGKYKRNEKGERILGSDGKPIFVETGEPILFKSKQEMIDATMQFTMDPKVRTGMLLNEQELELFKSKTGVQEKSKSKLAQEKAELEEAQIKQRGDIQKEVAQIYAAARKSEMANRQSGKSNSDTAVKDYRKQLRTNIAQQLEVDMDEIPTWQIKEMKKIKAFEEWEHFDTAYERLLQAGSSRKQNLALKQIREKFDVPESYTDMLKKLLLKDEGIYKE